MLLLIAQPVCYSISTCQRRVVGPDQNAGTLQGSDSNCPHLGNVGEQLWHLQLGSGEAKHALFGESRAFRKLCVYLDDDLTRQQLAGPT